MVCVEEFDEALVIITEWWELAELKSLIEGGQNLKIIFVWAILEGVLKNRKF